MRPGNSECVKPVFYNKMKPLTICLPIFIRENAEKHPSDFLIQTMPCNAHACACKRSINLAEYNLAEIDISAYIAPFNKIVPIGVLQKGSIDERLYQ